MIAAGCTIEEAPEGRSLVVTGPWSDAAARVIARGEVDGLVLNYARGFCEGSLELLRNDWEVRRLDVLDRSIRDLDPISRLADLRALSVQAASDAVLDISALPGLESTGCRHGARLA